MISPRIHVGHKDAAVLLHSGLLGVDIAQIVRFGVDRMAALRLDPISLLSDGRGIYSPVDPDEHWQTIEELIAQNVIGAAALGVPLGRGDDPATPAGIVSGDCEDWATAVAAWLRVTGQDVDALPIVYGARPDTGHVVTWHPRGNRGRGAILDPSRWGGMAGPLPIPTFGHRGPACGPGIPGLPCFRRF
jgi:hypothetical protein